MNYRLSESAVEDLQSAIGHYHPISRGLAAGLIEEVARCLKLLSSNPHAGRSISEHFRRMPLNRYPYFLIYQVDAKQIFVLSVYHQRRHPELWRNRVQEEPAIYQLAA